MTAAGEWMIKLQTFVEINCSICLLDKQKAMFSLLLWFSFKFEEKFGGNKVKTLSAPIFFFHCLFFRQSQKGFGNFPNKWWFFLTLFFLSQEVIVYQKLTFYITTFMKTFQIVSMVQKRNDYKGKTHAKRKMSELPLYFTLIPSFFSSSC